MHCCTMIYAVFSGSKGWLCAWWAKTCPTCIASQGCWATKHSLQAAGRECLFVVRQPLLAARVLQPAISSTVQQSALTLSSVGAGPASRDTAELEQWPAILQQIMKAQGLTHAMPVQARSVQCCSLSGLLGNEGQHGVHCVIELWSIGAT